MSAGPVPTTSPVRRVVLHVGAPKTGTSYVQDVLWRHRDQLAERGVHYRAERPDEHFLAALDLMQLDWGGLEREAVGAWQRLADDALSHEGTVVISHEILAKATRAQVRRVLTSLDGLPGGSSEVHVVYTARDLARQLPAEWQENVKHRRALRFTDFLARLRVNDLSDDVAQWFWQVQDVPDVLDRWGFGLPPQRVHLVTVPQPGGPRSLLWERVRDALGIDDTGLDLEVQRANASLGAPEAALLRRINDQVNRGTKAPVYREFVRELVAHRTLSLREGPRIGLTAEVHAWAEQLSRSWVDTLRGRGYDVVGDLDELLPAAHDDRPDAAADPDHVDESQVNGAALDVIGALVTEAGRLRAEQDDLHGEVDRLHRELQQIYDSPGYRARQLVVRVVRRSGPGRRVHRAYRRARGRD